MRFAVLNPWGRDPDRMYPGGPSSPRDPGHPPVNYHAYAACMRGGWFRDVRAIHPETQAVLVLLRRNGLQEALAAIRVLKRRGTTCWISWKESGAHQVAGSLEDPKRLRLFTLITSEADGFISSTPGLVDSYRAFGMARGGFIPTPYPLEYPTWDFSIPIGRRSGVFVGTREFDVPSRNHMAAICQACVVAAEREKTVSVMSTSPRERRLLLALTDRFKNLRILDGPLPYTEYLAAMAAHEAVFQLDSSHVPGQVAGDALLTRLPCIGGNGAIDEIVRVPHQPGEAPSSILRRLLEDPVTARESFEAAWLRATATASYQAGTTMLSQLCGIT